LGEKNPLTDSMHTEEEKRVREAVTRFLLSSINLTKLNDEDDLFESGIVNSLFAVQLMTFLEKSFSIEVGMDDLDIENFKSVNATTAFVLRKKGWQRAGATS
jgi:methoxymalonate biosynthesis acyl carrier protein